MLQESIPRATEVGPHSIEGSPIKIRPRGLAVSKRSWHRDYALVLIVTECDDDMDNDRLSRVLQTVQPRLQLRRGGM